MISAFKVMNDCRSGSSHGGRNWQLSMWLRNVGKRLEIGLRSSG